MTADFANGAWPGVVSHWPELEPLLDTCRGRLNPGHHGDAAEWRRALDALPEVVPSHFALTDTVTIGKPSDIGAGSRATLLESLRALRPWRKGPFEFFGTRIDTEWRSDWKWRRIAGQLGDLSGLRILDVGAGNGYFGWRMLEAGAASVLGIDPTILFNMQHLAVTKYLADVSTGNALLPLRLEEMPPEPRFDVVFSLGVIYHRRDPAAHLAKLAELVREGGRVVVESLTVDETYAPCLVPKNRYARMRNVHAIPTVETLKAWLGDAGFTDVRIVDVNRTSVDEQRCTDWMRFDSLARALDPANDGLTVEGYPAPVRACVMALR